MHRSEVDANAQGWLGDEFAADRRLQIAHERVEVDADQRRCRRDRRGRARHDPLRLQFSGGGETRLRDTFVPKPGASLGRVSFERGERGQHGNPTILISHSSEQL